MNETIIKKINNCGSLTLYRRPRSNCIYYRYYDSKNKKLVRLSTETNLITTAETIAKEKYFEYRQVLHNLSLLSNETYESVGYKLLDEKRLNEEAQGIESNNRSKSQNFKYQHEEIIQSIGQVPVKNIDKSKINEVLNHIRKTKQTNKKSTINKYKSTIRQVLEFAIDKKIITHLPNFPKVDGDEQKRIHLENDEYNRIRSAIKQEMIDDKKNFKLLEELYDVFVFCVNTGIRVGSELDNLKMKDITLDQEDCLKITIRKSKTIKGVRTIISLPLKSTFERMKKRYSNSNDYIYLNHLARNYAHRQITDLWKDVLKKHKLNKDINENDIDLYVCRHTYIVWRLLEGRNIQAIALNCGTSIQMIEKHYAYAMTPIQYADELRNKRIEKSKKSKNS